MKTNCKIIQDLLPLYIDDFCSNESRSLVEDHLKECEICSRKFNDQKCEIEVNEELIKENLKAKRPFKKIITCLTVALIIIAILIPVSILTYNTIDSDRVAFLTIAGRMKSQIFLWELEKGQFEKAADHVQFSGAYGVDLTEEEEKKQWIEGMKKLKNDGIEIISHRDTVIESDDGFTCGYTIIEIKYDNKLYDFKLGLYTNRKVEVGGLGYSADQSQSDSEVKEMIMNRFNEFIKTYNPG
ncbi:zf-HC2 domain-containing protein [Acetivibrio cellulolyticus]